MLATYSAQPKTAVSVAKPWPTATRAKMPGLGFGGPLIRSRARRQLTESLRRVIFAPKRMNFGCRES